METIHTQAVTVEEYLAFERASEERHEYINSTIRLMPRSNVHHSLIMGNASACLHGQLRKSPCETFVYQIRLKIPTLALYTYPDISVVCGDPEFEDRETDTLLNPTLIAEVVAPITESYDRGKKFQHYRTLESLRQYVLVSQDNPRIEVFTRQPDDQWLLSEAVGLESEIELHAITCTLRLSDVYEKGSFEDEAESGTE